MILERPIAELASCSEYFRGPQLAMVVDSIVAGHTAGRLWQAEGCALLWDQGNHVLYLASPQPTPIVNAALGELIAGPVRSAALASGRARFKVRALAAELDQALPQIFGNLQLKEWPELFLRYQHPQPPIVAAPTLPGLRFVAIDSALLAQTELANSALLREEISWMWPSIGRFEQYGFGTAALIDQQLVCWCTAEYLGGSMCGIGISTDEAYQRQGIATATAALFVSASLQRDLIPCWECVTHNAGSVRVAQKLGFTLVEQALFYSGYFPA